MSIGSEISTFRRDAAALREVGAAALEVANALLERADALKEKLDRAGGLGREVRSLVGDSGVASDCFKPLEVARDPGVADGVLGDGVHEDSSSSSVGRTSEGTSVAGPSGPATPFVAEHTFEVRVALDERDLDLIGRLVAQALERRARVTGRPVGQFR